MKANFQCQPSPGPSFTSEFTLVNHNVITLSPYCSLYTSHFSLHPEKLAFDVITLLQRPYSEVFQSNIFSHHLLNVKRDTMTVLDSIHNIHTPLLRLDVIPRAPYYSSFVLVVALAIIISIAVSCYFTRRHWLPLLPALQWQCQWPRWCCCPRTGIVVTRATKVEDTLPKSAYFHVPDAFSLQAHSPSSMVVEPPSAERAAPQSTASSPPDLVHLPAQSSGSWPDTPSSGYDATRILALPMLSSSVRRQLFPPSACESPPHSGSLAEPLSPSISESTPPYATPPTSRGDRTVSRSSGNSSRRAIKLVVSPRNRSPNDPPGPDRTIFLEYDSQKRRTRDN